MDAPPPRDEPDPLDALVFEALERLEAGGESAWSELLARHPERAPALRARVEALRAMGLVGGGGAPRRLGEFRILGTIGAGGMGVVYRAVQEPLGREVALKVVRPEHLFFPGARERFQREVETVARLQHPGIVAVHAVGQQDGVPYFAMELVRGRGLDEILRDLAGRDPATLSGRDLDPRGEGRAWLFEGTWEQACLRAMRQVCEALEFAHQCGVLHRDLKPSNVMITSEGAPRALLLDFGLATSAGSSKLTRTGSQLGSLRYMASEQLQGQGQRIGPRTDVYGLGVTLYELLCNAPAYTGRSDVELALAIQRGDLPPLRVRNPAASWEAETICATATDPDPARRYASAADLARDLDNALSRRPIEARRAGAALRLRRWAERRPAAATALAMAALALVGGPLAYAWQQRRAAREVAVERDRAERLADLTLEAMDRMLTRLGAEDLRLIPQVEPVRQAALEDAVELAERLLLEQQGDPRARSEAADAHARLGRLLGELGRSAEAVTALESGVELLAGLSAAAPDDDVAALRLARLRVDLATALSRAGRLEEAQPLFEAVDAQLAERLARGPARADLIELRLAGRTALGVLLKQAGRLAQSLETLRDCTRLADERLARHPDDLGVLERALEAWNELGLLQSTELTTETGPGSPEAVAALERTVELGQALLERASAEPRLRMRLATALNNLSGAYRRMREFEGAAECSERARELLEPLVRDYPSTLSYRLELATVRNQLGVLQESRGRVLREAGDLPGFRREFLQAEPHYAATLELLEGLVEAAPQEVALRHRLAIVRFNLGMLERYAREDHARGAGYLAQALEAALAARALAPTDAQVVETLRDVRSGLIEARLAVGDLTAAARAIDEFPHDLPDRWQSWSRATVYYAKCVAAARALPGLDPEERERRVEGYAARACDMARAAIERGVPDPTGIGRLQDLAPLHGTEAFERLLFEVGAE